MVFVVFPLFVLNTLFNAVFLFNVVLLAKLVVPVPGWRRACDRALVRISLAWTRWNTRVLAIGGFKVAGQVAPGIELRTDARYLIISNHLSWTDIFALQTLFHSRTPFLTFFLKRQLLYVPVFGVIWWALGFPFMARVGAAQAARRPELRLKDLETTKRFCKRIRGHPYAIINFVEGTRRTPRKAAASPYRHLLVPRAGGIATALQALEYEFDHVLDVTLLYASEQRSFLDLLKGNVGRVLADVREIPLPSIPRGDYFSDPAYADRFRTWLNGYWREKDERFEALSAEAKASCAS